MDIILKASIPSGKIIGRLQGGAAHRLPSSLVFCFSIAPVSPSILLCFLLRRAAKVIIVGIAVPPYAMEMSMSPSGRAGARCCSLLKSRSVLLIIEKVGFCWPPHHLSGARLTGITPIRVPPSPT